MGAASTIRFPSGGPRSARAVVRGAPCDATTGALPPGVGNMNDRRRWYGRRAATAPAVRTSVTAQDTAAAVRTSVTAQATAATAVMTTPSARPSRRRPPNSPPAADTSRMPARSAPPPPAGPAWCRRSCARRRSRGRPPPPAGRGRPPRARPGRRRGSSWPADGAERRV